MYMALLRIDSLKQFPEAILQLIAEYSIRTAECLVCGLRVRINKDPKQWISTRLSSVKYGPHDFRIAPREVVECVWTTTEDLDRWYILNLNIQGIPGRFPRQKRYQHLPLASDYQIICGCCASCEMTRLKHKFVEAARRSTGGASDIEWLRWLSPFLITDVYRQSPEHKEFIKKISRLNKKGKRFKLPTEAEIDERIQKLYPLYSK